LLWDSSCQSCKNNFLENQCAPIFYEMCVFWAKHKIFKLDVEDFPMIQFFFLCSKVLEGFKYAKKRGYQANFEKFSEIGGFWSYCEAFDCKCEAFIKTTRLFEDIFKEMEASIRNLRLFQRLRGLLNIFNKIEAFYSDVRLFQRIRGFFKTFKEKLRLFLIMWGILNDFEAF
jgi:hypothetical protein